MGHLCQGFERCLTTMKKNRSERNRRKETEKKVKRIELRKFRKAQGELLRFLLDRSNRNLALPGFLKSANSFRRCAVI